jgi:micrococcal nuclease
MIKIKVFSIIIFSILFFQTGCISNNDKWEPVYDENYSVKVTRIIDGDTFYIILPNGSEEIIRLLGIDTPETSAENNHKYEYGNITDLECLASFGVEAKNVAEFYLLNEDVTIKFDSLSGFKDYYDRWLAYLFLENGEDYNHKLVKEGLARVYETETFSKKNNYIDSQLDTINNSIGFWKCQMN